MVLNGSWIILKANRSNSNKYCFCWGLFSATIFGCASKDLLQQVFLFVFGWKMCQALDTQAERSIYHWFWSWDLLTNKTTEYQQTYPLKCMLVGSRSQFEMNQVYLYFYLCFDVAARSFNADSECFIVRSE